MLANGAYCQNLAGKSSEPNQGYTWALGLQYETGHDRIEGLLISTPVSCACSPLKSPVRILRTSNSLLARNQLKEYTFAAYSIHRTDTEDLHARTRRQTLGSSNVTIRVGLPSFRELYSVTVSLYSSSLCIPSESTHPMLEVSPTLLRCSLDAIDIQE